MKLHTFNPQNVSIVMLVSRVQSGMSKPTYIRITQIVLERTANLPVMLCTDYDNSLKKLN